MKKLAVFLMLFSVCAFAQKADDPPTFGGLTGTVTDGAVTYGYNGFGGTDAAGTDFTGASGGDDLFESWWYFRAAGDAQEFPFPDPDSATYVGNTVTLSWADVGGRGLFSAELVDVVSDGGGPSGSMLATMTLTDLGSGTQFDMFYFADIDLGGSFGGDNATISGTDFISLFEGADTGEFRAGGADAAQALAFPGLDPILSDGVVDNLDGSGFPFGPGDFTGAFQWSLSLEGEQGVTLQAAIAINQAAPAPAPPVFTGTLPDAPAVPTMSTWGLIALSLLLIVAGSLLIRRTNA